VDEALRVNQAEQGAIDDRRGLSPQHTPDEQIWPAQGATLTFKQAWFGPVREWAENGGLTGPTIG
jgi:hypothetical protein